MTQDPTTPYEYRDHHGNLVDLSGHWRCGGKDKEWVAALARKKGRTHALYGAWLSFHAAGYTNQDIEDLIEKFSRGVRP